MNFLKTLVDSMINPAPPKVVVKRVAHRNPVGPASARTIVERDTVPLWAERHWQKSGQTYTGFYRTEFGSWEGRIEETPGGLIRFYLNKPPACLSSHSHYSCFLPKGGGLYEVHFRIPAKTASDGIVQIERILGEAHQAA